MAADLGLLVSATATLERGTVHARREGTLSTAVAAIAAKRRVARSTCSHQRRGRQQQSAHMPPQGLDRWRRVRDPTLASAPSFVLPVTLNGATQPKPNLSSLTPTSLLWLGWPTWTLFDPSSDTFQASERARQLRLVILGCRSRVDQCRWLLETICPALGHDALDHHWGALPLPDVSLGALGGQRRLGTQLRPS